MGLFDRDPTRALRTRAGALLREGKFAEALPICQRVVELAPRLVDGWSDLGWALLGLKRYEEAISACETALFLDERSMWAWNNKGAALARLGRHDEALAAYDRAIALDPAALKYGRTTAHYNRLRELLDLKRYEEALASANLLLRFIPRQANVWVSRAQALSGLKRDDEAEAALAQALKVAPADWFALVQSCLFYGNQRHDYAKALVLCQRMLDLHRDDGYAHTLKGDVLRLLERPAEACVAYEQAIDHAAERGGRSDVFWLSYGRMLTRTGRYGEALAAFDLVDRPTATVANARAVQINRGVVLSAIERHSEALACYERAREIDPTSALALTNAAEELVELGRFSEAAALADRALAFDAEFPCRRHTKGILAAARGEFAEARMALQASIEDAPSHSAHHADLADVLIALDDPEQACATIERALALDPYDARSWRIKAAALRAAGKLEEAAEAERHSAALLAEQTAQVDAWLQARAERGEPGG